MNFGDNSLMLKSDLNLPGKYEHSLIENFTSHAVAAVRIIGSNLTYFGRFTKTRSIPPEVFLEKGVLKICSKFKGEHPCRSVIMSPVNLLHIFRTPFYKNIY